MKLTIAVVWVMATTVVYANSEKNIEQQIRKKTKQLTEAESADDLAKFLVHYSDDAIVMPEYQAIVTGKENVRNFYQEIFLRQHIKRLTRAAEEFIFLGESIVEISVFEKSYADVNYKDSLIILKVNTGIFGKSARRLSQS